VSLFHPISSKVVGFGSEEDLQSFTFDSVFSGSASQDEVFDTIARPILADVLCGFNGTILAYGQTGSGKTYTILGELNNDQKQGIVPRLASNLFFSLDQDSEEDSECLVKLSMLEVYKDKLVDLLNPASNQLKIKQTLMKGVFVSGLAVVCPTCPKEFLEVVVMGQDLRTVASTRMNSSSSRSHLLMTAEIIQTNPHGTEKRGLLNLVDLAGSEKVRNSGVTGQTLEETKKINLSLSALGNVISALVAGKDHVPYRDSKLTRILQDSLGGNFKTSLVVNCSPGCHSKEETINSLSFALRAKLIKNRVKVNLKENPESYLKIIEALRTELFQAKAELQSLREKSTLVETRAVSHSYVGRRPQKTLSSSSSKKNRITVESPIALGSTRNTPISIDLPTFDKKNFIFEQEFINSSFFTPDKGNEDLKETQEDFETKKKLFEIEEKNEELQSENKKLLKKLKKSQEKISKLEKKSLEYYSLYHKTLNLIHKDSSEHLLLIKKNENLTKSLKFLVNSLQELEKKLSHLSDLQASRDITRVEFIDTIIPSKKTTESEEILESSSELEFSIQELSLNPEKMSFCSTYGQTLEQALESNKALSKDLIIYQLKAQIVEASMFNSNLAWKLESLSWKINLLNSKLQIKTLQNKQNKIFLQNCEKITDELYKFVKKPLKIVDIPSPTEKKAKMLRSFFARSFKSDQIEKSFASLSFLGPSFEIDAEGLTNKFKSIEVQVEVLETANRQLKIELENERRKKSIKDKSLKALDEVVKRFEREKELWKTFYVQSRKNCQVELARKQEELNKLNEILAEWINRFMEVQEGLVSREMHRKIQLLMINTVNFYSQDDPLKKIFENSPLN
jgi:hypothetical protein